jgi:hypothetical protein
MATRAVFAAADEQHNDEQDDRDERDEPKYLHPARCAGRGFAVRPHAGVVAGIGVGGRVSHDDEVYETVCRCQSNVSRILG